MTKVNSHKAMSGTFTCLSMDNKWSCSNSEKSSVQWIHTRDLTDDPKPYIQLLFAFHQQICFIVCLFANSSLKSKSKGAMQLCDVLTRISKSKCNVRKKKNISNDIPYSTSTVYISPTDGETGSDPPPHWDNGHFLNHSSMFDFAPLSSNLDIKKW